MGGRPKLIGDKDRLIPPEQRDEVLAWLKAEARKPGGRQAEWTRLAILLADQAGLRVSEIVRLQVRDCDVLRRPYRLLIRGAKHRTSDHVDEQPIGEALAGELRGYVTRKDVPHLERRYVVGMRSVPYSRQAVLLWVKRAHQACGLASVYAIHSWRHGYGTRIYLETRDLVMTQRMLRHRSTGPTERYVHMANAMAEMDKVLAAVAATSGRPRKSTKSSRAVKPAPRPRPRPVKPKPKAKARR